MRKRELVIVETWWTSDGVQSVTAIHSKRYMTMGTSATRPVTGRSAIVVVRNIAGIPENGKHQESEGTVTRDLTPTEMRLYRTLSDGNRHTKKDLHDCLDDDMAGRTAVKKHITEIRKKLRPRGLDVTCERHDGSVCYRLVRMLSPPRTEDDFHLDEVKEEDG